MKTFLTILSVIFSIFGFFSIFGIFLYYQEKGAMISCGAVFFFIFLSGLFNIMAADMDEKTK